MALTDDEQQEILTKVREIWDQLRGPNGEGWPQLGKRADGSDLTPVDGLAAVIEALDVLAGGPITGLPLIGDFTAGLMTSFGDVFVKLGELLADQSGKSDEPGKP